MSFYQRRILPRIIDLSMRNRDLASYRERVLSAAEGRVLEVGIGSGLNLPFYAGRATSVAGLEHGRAPEENVRRWQDRRADRHQDLICGQHGDCQASRAFVVRCAQRSAMKLALDEWRHNDLQFVASLV